jgi:hypothetical protein
MSRQPNHAHVVAEVLSTKLSANTHLLGELVDTLLPL